MARPLVRLAAATLAASLLFACQGGDLTDGTSPCTIDVPCTSQPDVAEVRLGAFPDSLFVGDTATLVAHAVNASGDTLQNVAITYESAAPDIASVNSVGLVTAVAAGSTSVSATAGGKTAEMPVLVAP